MTPKARRAWIIAADIFLVLCIIALLAAIWMPAFVGPHPNAPVLQ